MIDWNGVEAWIIGLPVWLLYVLVFLSAFMEGVPILGIPFPGNLVVTAVAIQAGLARHNPVPLLVTHAAGGVVADLLFYALGARYGLGFLTALTSRWPPSWRFDESRHAQLRRLFDQHGFKAIVVARVSPGIRNMFAWVAGAVHLRIRRMLLGAVTGGLLIAAFFVTSGYLIGMGYHEAGAILGKTLTYSVVALGLAILVGYLLTRRLRVFTPRTLVLAFGVLAAVPAFVAILLDHVRHGRLRAWEESSEGWGVGHHLSWGIPRWLTGPEPALAVVLLVFALLSKRGRWREALGVAFAACAAIGSVVALHSLLPRPVPDGASTFPLAPGFVDMTAMLVVLATSFVAVFFLPPATTFLRHVWMGLVWATGVAAAIMPALLGRSHLADTLAGIALGAAVACLALLVDVLALNMIRPPEGDHVGARAIRHLRLGAERLLDAFGRVAVRPAAAWGLVAFGVVARLLGPWRWALGPDATRYAGMAKGLMDTGSFTMPWGDVYTPGVAGPSHHYPPLYPMVLAGFYKVLGFSETTTRVASITLSLAALVVVYACTRDLYGKVAARITTAIVAVSPILIQTTNKGYAENLVLALFVASMWGILKSLEKPWFIVAGGAFAALAYLTKSSMGAFFLVAGVGGLAWRLYWKGWRVLRQVPYLVAIAVFGSAVLAWAYRNWRLFGDWQTSTHLQAAYTLAIHHPAQWLHLVPWSFAVMFGLGYLLFMAVWPWLPRLASIPRLANEHDSGLWLAFGLPVVLTVAIDAALWNYEHEFFLHNVRYVSFAIVPIVWLLVRHVRPDRSTWLALVASLTVLCAATAYYAAIPNVPDAAKASDALGHVLGDGQSLAFVDTNDVYRVFMDATHNGHRSVSIAVYYGHDALHATQDWVFAAGDAPDLPPAYVLTETIGHGASYTIWHRAA